MPPAPLPTFHATGCRRSQPLVMRVATGPDSGLVRALSAGGRPGAVAFSGVDQVFTSPAAG
ncbi:MAG TPA: hypothetical protein VFE78_38245 [Gemmataceae bacterium]|nr:hypothetical protein [Gemmataceae bacterium]